MYTSIVLLAIFTYRINHFSNFSIFTDDSDVEHFHNVQRSKRIR